ncbi:MAG: Peptidase family, partial [Pedosphaera sp.]|nr:Peptidase family [Pedosphaera sp.]
GAYEFQSPSSLISYAWLQQYGFPTDGSADFGDPDGDQMNNWQEWLSGTDPTDSASLLRMLDLIGSPPHLTVSWQSVTNRTYSVERSTNSVSFQVLATPLRGQANVTSYTDNTANGSGPFFYRVSTHP